MLQVSKLRLRGGWPPGSFLSTLWIRCLAFLALSHGAVEQYLEPRARRPEVGNCNTYSSDSSLFLEFVFLHTLAPTPGSSLAVTAMRPASCQVQTLNPGGPALLWLCQNIWGNSHSLGASSLVFCLEMKGFYPVPLGVRMRRVYNMSVL